MAYIDCKLKSQLLQRTVAVKLYFPTDLPAEVGNTVKGVLTLLHGYTNCGEDWLQMTAAARYAADNGLVLIIPDCDNSFYQNMVYGGAYYSFMTEELPLLLRTIFRLSPPRSQNYIAGLSMGGYGALYLGFSRPDIWARDVCAHFWRWPCPAARKQPALPCGAGGAAFARAPAENFADKRLSGRRALFHCHAERLAARDAAPPAAGALQTPAVERRARVEFLGQKPCVCH